MPPDSAVAASTRSDPLYSALQERVMARDQKGASEVYYSLVRDGRPLPEMLREAVRIHAPYTHVPYHERLDDGFVNFVNNDHCLLSARASLNLSKMLPGGASGLPMAQTIWYMPTGLDIWNQKIAKAPGHYARGFQMPDGPPPVPVVHWPDQAPQALDGPLKDRLGHWMTLVHRGQVVDAYRVFLGLMQNPAERRAALAELCFAGLIDVQDRSFHNRSYTTGHKSFRARATVELGEAIGWDDAHDVLYAGALDIAVGPRWYSLYEAASNAILIDLEGQTLHAVPYSGTTEQERAILANNKAPLDAAETDALIEVILRQPEPAYLRAPDGAPEGRQEPARHPRCDPGRRRRGRDRDPRRAQLLPAAALLRVLQHAGLVLGQVRPSAAAEAALSRRRLPQPGRLAPEADRRSHAAAHREARQCRRPRRR